MPPVSKSKRQRCATFIRQWREFVGLSQEQLAARLDVSRETVSRIENGISPYNQDFLEQAALGLGCDVADLLDVDPSAWPLAKLIAKQVSELRQDQQKQVLAMVRGLVNFNKAA